MDSLPLGGAFGIFAAPSGPATPRSERPVPQVPAGTTVIRDTFTSSTVASMFSPELQHGYSVAAAATDQAGETPLIMPSLGDEPKVHNPMGPGSPTSGFGDRELSQEEALAMISQQTEQEASFFLDDQSDYLERAAKSGTENSVVNFSLRGSKAARSLSLYQDVMGAVYDPSSESKAAKNYGTAFGIDPEKIRSEDKAISQAEEAKLQQAVIDNVSTTVDNSDKIQSSMDRWDAATENFEKGNNSVVVGAGNEGEIEETLEKWAGGEQLQLPDDFETNYLENDVVTSVGATTPAGDEAGTRAEYSSESRGVDIYADGTSKGLGDKTIQGTSFAAPRVSVVMAELHKKHPNLSSAQVENLMTSNLTTQVPNNGTTIPVLRPEVDLKFLQESTF